jgi:hypothetical protein
VFLSGNLLVDTGGWGKLGLLICTLKVRFDSVMSSPTPLRQPARRLHGRSALRAKNRRGLPCGCPAMRNGPSRLHGGVSTGPRTPEGLKALRQARPVHGFSSRSAIEQRRQELELPADSSRICTINSGPSELRTK